MHRVFITGVGVVSCVGTDRDSYWDALTAGRCGLTELTVHDTTDLPVTIGGEIRDIDVDQINLNDRVNAKRMDRASQFAVWGANQACADAGLEPSSMGTRCGVILGAGLSGLATLQTQTEKLLDRGPARVSPFTIPMLMPNAAPANVGMALGINGPCYTVSSACSSSGHAMINAFEALRSGQMDAVVTGGTESSMTRLGIAAFCKMGAMSTRYNDQPTRSVRPFEADRAGLIMSEGSGVMVFETEEAMNRRGAKPYAEVLGYGSTSDSHNIVAPDPEAVQATTAIRDALQSANVAPTDIANSTYVNAHGTATEFNDLMETAALKNVFGDTASALQISSTKSTIGHAIGAACGMEMIACVMALRTGVLPPTINYETPDLRCDLDYVPNEPREADVRYVINNTFGFGGHNVSLLIGAVDVQVTQGLSLNRCRQSDPVERPDAEATPGGDPTLRHDGDRQ